MNKKLLFIRFWSPEIIKNGGEQLTDTNFSYLTHILGDKQVDSFAVNSIFRTSLLQKIIDFLQCCRSYHKGLNAAKIKNITTLAKNYDYIYIDRSVFGIIAKKLKETSYQGKIITFFHNCEYHYYQDRYKSYNPLKFWILRCVRTNEKAAVMYSDKIITLNSRDQRDIESYYHRKSNYIIPISIHQIYIPNETILDIPMSQPLNALFVGSFFPANIDGILWFIRKVLPFTNLKLKIVGKDMKKLLSYLSETDLSKIKIAENVPDIKPFYENADITVLPIFKGSGMKVKTCEAMMYGKYMIGTTEAFEGYDIDFHKAGALANTDSEFIEAIKNIKHQNLNRFNQYNFDCFKQKYAAEITLQKFKEVLSK